LFDMAKDRRPSGRRSSFPDISFARAEQMPKQHPHKNAASILILMIFS
jgi:hypothetical protein